jgi:aspartyl-tRNA(Asn)/glutamyl-tRNA(Gln) amidotransferase subunit A
MMVTDISIAEASDLLRRKQISPVELTTSCLARVEQLNPTINAFITVMHDSALAQAREAEAEIRAGKWRGPLHGIPIGLKDLIDTAGVKTTCGSDLFKDRVPIEDAEIVRRLKDAGAVLIGKQNMQEFAYGGTSTSSHFGPVHNPWDADRIAGGSSGGSAAAVATGMCFGAIGTDTGGSVREPAAFCGIVGLKPTYGRVSTRGVFPLSPSLDHVGPLCRNVVDTALLLQAIAGYDKLDTTSVDWPVDSYAEAFITKTKPRIGVVRRPFFDDLDPEIENAMDEALKQLGNLSEDVIEIDLPPTVCRPGARSVRRTRKVLHHITRAIWPLDPRAIKTGGGGGHSCLRRSPTGTRSRASLRRGCLFGSRFPCDANYTRATDYDYRSLEYVA